MKSNVAVSRSSKLALFRASRKQRDRLPCHYPRPTGLLVSLMISLCASLPHEADGQEVTGIYRELFTAVGGQGTVADLTNSPAYTAGASATVILEELFESPSNIGDNYGQRLRAVLVAPYTGNYVFYICSDDQSVLYLGTDESAASKRLIAVEPVWNDSRDFTGTARRTGPEAVAFFPAMNPGLPANRSDNTEGPIQLTAGGRHYIEVLMKEWGSGDHLSVAWSRPDGSGGTVFEGPIPAGHFRAANVPPPTIAEQPTDVLVPLGGSANFRVLTGPAGPGPYSYQWFKDSQPLADGPTISGALAASLQITSVAESDQGPYRVVVSNAFGSVTSVVAQLDIQDPGFLTHPLSVAREPGQSATFSAEAAGTGSLQFQWLKDGSPLPNATSSTLVLDDLRGSDAGRYALVAGNSQGSVTSSPALLTVNLFAPENGFNPDINAFVLSIVQRANGRTLAGGFFTEVNSQPHKYLVQFEPNGTIDPGFNSDLDVGGVAAMALQPDGRLIIGGFFTSVAGQPRSQIARLNLDGTLDPTFDPGVGTYGGVRAIALQTDGKVLVGGQTSNYLRRLNTDGTLDDGFNPNANSLVKALVVQPDGKILVGGGFTTMGGQTRRGIARLNLDGAVDESFGAGALLLFPTVNTIALQSDGKILIGGNFSSVAGQPRNGLARLYADGSLDANFNSGVDPGNPSPSVDTLAVQPDGGILVGGEFTMLGGQLRENIGRLHPDGTIDATFDPGAESSFPPTVAALVSQSDGKILVGGSFTNLGGLPSNRFARLSTVNTAPLLTGIADQTVSEFAELAIAASASDQDLPAQTLTYSLTTAPTGMTINPSSGQITWTPTEVQGPGDFDVTVRVTDNGTPALAHTTSFSVTVNEVNVAPQLTLPGAQTVNEQVELAFTINGSDSDLPANALTYELVTGPTGATFNPATREFRWTPTEAQGPGNFTATFRVTDNNPDAVNTQQLTAEGDVNINVAEVNQQPTLTVIDNQTATEEALFSFTATATDPDLPANGLTYSLDTFPTGMTINPSSGEISWTPTEAQGPDSFDVTVRVTDNGTPPLAHTTSFSVAVSEANLAPTLTAVANDVVHAGTPFTLQLSATDPDQPANTFTYLLVTGPTGATVSPAGEVNWSVPPTAAFTQASFTVRVTDNGMPAQSDDEDFQLTITGTLQALETVLTTDSGGALLTITWRTVPGRTYRLVWSPDLPALSWTPVPELVVADGQTTTRTITVPTEPGGRYYQIELLAE